MHRTTDNSIFDNRGILTCLTQRLSASSPCALVDLNVDTQCGLLGLDLGFKPRFKHMSDSVPDLNRLQLFVRLLIE